jgi:hypothetical protein
MPTNDVTPSATAIGTRSPMSTIMPARQRNASCIELIPEVPQIG